MLAALAAMVAATDWRPWRVALVWPALEVLAFLAFGLLMAALACAPPQVLDFDANTRTVRGQARRLLGWSRPVALVFDRL